MAHCFELPLKPNNLTTSMLLQKFVSDVSVTRECDMCDFHTGGYILSKVVFFRMSQSWKLKMPRLGMP